MTMKKFYYVLLPFMVAVCSCNNSNKKADVTESKQEQTIEASNEVNNTAIEEVKKVSEEEKYILKPGVTYVTEVSDTGTDEYGGKVNLSMEFTIYKDGSATGNLIETNSSSTYDNNNSYDHPIEGNWHEVSKHDKRFLKIDLVLDANGYYKRFTYFVDEDHNAYYDNVNNHPIKLRLK